MKCNEIASFGLFLALGQTDIFPCPPPKKSAPVWTYSGMAERSSLLLNTAFVFFNL